MLSVATRSGAVSTSVPSRSKTMVKGLMRRSNRRVIATMEAGWLDQCRVLIARAGLLSLREMCARDAHFADRLQSWTAPEGTSVACALRVSLLICGRFAHIREHQLRESSWHIDCITNKEL